MRSATEKIIRNLRFGKLPIISGSWIKASKENEGTVPTRGTGNYSSDEAKEIARLQRELRDTKDALEILKKAIGILGK